MKKLILGLFLVIGAVACSYAQCDKRVIIVSSTTEHIKAGEVERTKEETSTIEFDAKEIHISPGDDAPITGTIKSTTCEWKTAFKEGKSVVKATVTDPRGQTFNITVTVEGKEGKISFLLEIEEQPDRKIRLLVDKFEEKK